MATARYISQQSPARRQRQCRRAAAPLKMILGMSLLFMAVPCWAYGFNNNSPLLIPKAAITSRRIHAAHVTARSSAFSSSLFRSRSSTSASSRTQQSRRGTQPLPLSPPLWMTSLPDADGEKKNLEEEAATTSIVGNKAETAAAGDDAAAVGGGSSDKDDNFESGGVLRTIFLAGPLFVKFAIVLIIKFATDLVVFPLLWLYRLARLTKIKFRKLLGRGGGKSNKKKSSSPGEAVNGSSGGGGPNGAVDWKNFKANGEQ